MGLQASAAPCWRRLLIQGRLRPLPPWPRALHSFCLISAPLHWHPPMSFIFHVDSPTYGEHLSMDELRGYVYDAEALEAISAFLERHGIPAAQRSLSSRPPAATA